MNNEIQHIAEKLSLEPHPEGGFYKETYRSHDEMDTPAGKRSTSTCIYFMLTSGSFSAFHKIKSDEIWHFYKGSTIHLHVISSTGKYSKHLIGSDIENGELPQFVVKAGDWFASEIIADNNYGLAGCTVSPGFDFNDFQLANPQELISAFPQHQELIARLTRID